MLTNWLVMTRGKGDNREKILQAAEHLFSEYGYDGTTVDRIAEEACVNKALIYYHFESKAEVVRVLYKRILDRVERMSMTAGESVRDQLRAELVGADEFRRGTTIMLMDALKGEGNDVLMQFGMAVIEKEHPELKSLPENERRIAVMREFFTGVVPFLMFCVLKKRWCGFTSVPVKQAEDEFVEIFTETHIRESEMKQNGTASSAQP